MKIVIKNKYLEVKEVKELLVSHNVNTYQMDVEFNESYLNRQLYVYFKNGNVKKFEVVGPDNKVNIPHEVLENIGKLYIGAFSPNEKDNTLLDRYCTNFDSIDVIEGAYDKDATPTEELTPTILEKYLQEMKNFYNESLEGYNTNAINKTEEFNKNYENKIKAYNDNSIQKINEYNKNADKREEEINNKVSDIEKIEDNIEQIQKNVQASERNAKTSETNAKTSAENAENSYQATVNIATNLSMLAFYVDENLKLHVVSESDLVNQKFNLVGNKLEVIYFAN